MKTRKKTVLKLIRNSLMPCSVASVLLLSACVNYGTKDGGVYPPDPGDGDVKILTNCAGQNDPGTILVVKVFFDSNNCPVYVDKSAPTLPRGPSNARSRINWQAYRSDNPGDILENKYEIHFDPFVGGRPLITKPNTGCIRSGPLDKSEDSYPPLIYEYTITAEDTNGNQCPPLDPRFIVN